jgi:hypothetical protein
MSTELLKLGHVVAGLINHIHVNVLAGIGLVLWKVAPRIDHLFESLKHSVAETSGNLGFLWAESELGRVKKLVLLIYYSGFRRTMRGLLGETLNGWHFERRSRRGTSRDRMTQGEDARQRRFDDPSIVMLISRRVCFCNAAQH